MKGFLVAFALGTGLVFMVNSASISHRCRILKTAQYNRRMADLSGIMALCDSTACMYPLKDYRDHIQAVDDEELRSQGCSVVK